MTLSIYRSTDEIITTSDTLVATVVAELVTSKTSSQSTMLAASTNPGASYSGGGVRGRGTSSCGHCGKLAAPEYDARALWLLNRRLPPAPHVRYAARRPPPGHR